MNSEKNKLRAHKKTPDVLIFEVGPRDGLQNEPGFVQTATKIDFIKGLAHSGLQEIEVGAFVRPDRVPQMADSDLVLKRTSSLPIKAWCLVPNLKGLERALAAHCKNIAIFTAATESFSKRNIGMSISEAFEEYQKMVSVLKNRQGIRLRGYISTAFGCPFEGSVDPKKTLKVLDRFFKLGVGQVSIGDTIGVATPRQIESVFKPALKSYSSPQLAGHFHNTRGTALANTLRALDLGVRVFDSSAGGLGGCPFAPGASGNLATEDLVYLLDGMGLSTGVDLKKLASTSLKLSKKMKRPLTSKVLQALGQSPGLVK